jgi:preprotein translocase subunit SecA
MRQIEKYAYLGSIDHLWIDHIDRIDGLREAIGLRAYGQRDPLVEFKAEAYGMFEGLIDKIDEELSHRLFRIGVAVPQPEIPLEQARENIDRSDMMGLAGGVEETAQSGEPAFAKPPITNHQSPITKSKLGRNDPCWCGSGKKWKKCHYPQLPPH